MEFRILGPLEVVGASGVVSLGGQRQRALLALLLLHRNESVAVDRLADELWGERLPDTAAKTVQVYVSRLRSELGDGRIETRGHGYVLRLEAGELDLDRFEELVERSRGEEPRAAAGTLREALALFRGEPLGDLAYEPWAQSEVARLQELRLAALEQRLDTDLQLGQHRALVAELEALVREHPLRERLRGDLMLALYRSGRQAEALEAYRQARALLDEQLGLEPGPELRELEQRILTHDSSLTAPAAPLVERVRRRRGLLLVLAGGALLLAAAIASAVIELTGRSAAIASVPANWVATIDPKTNGVKAVVPVAGRPTRLSGGGGAVWVSGDESGTVSMLDRARHEVKKLVPVGGFPSDLAVGEGAVWVIDGRSGLLAKVDPTYGVVAPRVKIAASNPVYDLSREAFDATSVAAGAGSVWLTDGTRKLTRVDPATSKVVDRIDLRTPLDGVTVTAGALWAISGASATAIRLDRRGRVAWRIRIVSRPGFESPYPLEVRVGEGYVWVLNANTATVTKIDPEQRTVSARIPIGIDRGPVRLAVGDGAAWVANRDGTLARIDPTTDDVTFIPVAHSLRDVAVADGFVWVTTGTGLSGASGASANVGSGRVQPLPTSSCSPIYYAGPGQPTHLIVSDLPLQGSGNQTPQFSQAIQFVLRQHGFRAGRYSIGYQSCDDSIFPQSFWSDRRCAANAHAYTRDLSVIGVIGPHNSGCSQIEVPILDRAPRGPLAVISFSNTYVGLTRSGPSTAANEPARYYPTGRRNYVRIIAADDFQAAADAIVARQLGARSAYVLFGDDAPYSTGIAADFRSVAARLGLKVVGFSRWRYNARSFAKLSETVARSGAGAVFLAGSGIGNFGTLIKDLRAALGPRVRMVADDGYSDFGLTIGQAGAAAEGMTMSVTGLPNDRLPTVGKAFVAHFATAVGETPDGYSVSAAQAAEVLLAAIARSDGTRASVVAQLFKTKVTNGILGSFAIDRNGDTTAGSVTIYRIVRGNPTVVGVITPPASLVGG